MSHSSPRARPVLGRLLLPLSVLLALLLGGMGWVLVDLHQDHLAASLRNLLEDVDRELHLSLQEQADGLVVAAAAIAADEELRADLQALDRAALLRQWADFFARIRREFDITHFYIHGPDRVCLLRLHQPERHSDLIDRFTAREAERSRRAAAGIELGPLGTFTLRVVEPIRSGKEILGYVELGKEIEDVLTDVQTRLDIELALLIDKSRLNPARWEEGMQMLERDADWEQFADRVLSFASDPRLVERLNPELRDFFARAAPGSGPEIPGEITAEIPGEDDTRWWIASEPVRDVSGAEVGQLILFKEISAERASFFRVLAGSLIGGLALLSLLVALVVALLRRADRQLLAQQQALEESDRLLHDLAQMVPGFLYQFERLPDGRSAIPFASEGIRDLFELAPEDVREDASAAYARIHPDDRARLQASIDESLEALTLWRMDYRVCLPQKGERWLRGVSRPECLPDGRARWFGYMADITDRKEDEERLLKTNQQLAAATTKAEAANRAKSEFLANVSHEIRTPLNGVLGVLQLLSHSPLDEDQRELLDTGLESGRALLQLINDILDFSKIEAGKLEVREASFRPRDLLHAICRIFDGEIRQKGLQLELRVAPQVPELVCSDPARLRQILLNLIGNAVKFTDAGKVEVGLDAEFTSDDGRGAELQWTIADTGIGIDAQKVEEVFEPFVQADASDTRRYKGTGLGLSIVKRLVDLLGGRLAVESELGVGTRMQFSIPVRVIGGQPVDPDTFGRPLSATLDTPSGAGLSILVAEDERANQIVVERLLTKLGHRVTCVDNGRDAVDALAAGGFDLILMGVQMPVLDGLETTRRIRADDSGRIPRDIPIVALSAHAFPEDGERFREAGMNDFLPKPVEFASLKALLEGYTKRPSMS